MPDESDPDLGRRFVWGDADAFESLFRLFQVDVYRWIFRIVGDHGLAEDGTVETFWRAYRARARFDPARPFGAWIRRIATNVACTQLKRARHDEARHAPLVAEPSIPARGPSDVRPLVRSALAALPAKLRVVAILALVEECSHAEIADALGLPIGTIKSRLHRATTRLRADLTRLGVAP